MSSCSMTNISIAFVRTALLATTRTLWWRQPGTPFA